MYRLTDARASRVDATRSKRPEAGRTKATVCVNGGEVVVGDLNIGVSELSGEGVELSSVMNRKKSHANIRLDSRGKQAGI